MLPTKSKYKLRSRPIKGGFCYEEVFYILHTGIMTRMEIYHNTKFKSPNEIMKETGCTALVNGVLFNPDGSLCLNNKINGEWVSNECEGIWGIAWSGNNAPKKAVSSAADDYDNFLSCCAVQPTMRRGRSAIGFSTYITPKKEIGNKYTIFCVPDGQQAVNYYAAEDTIAKNSEGVYLVLDGGMSCVARTPSGNIDTTDYRARNNQTYILFWEPKIIYRVQLGAFTSRSNAEILKDRLAVMGYKAFLVYSGGIYRVQVGAFGVKENAVALLSELKTKGFSGFITTTEN